MMATRVRFLDVVVALNLALTLGLGIVLYRALMAPRPPVVVTQTAPPPPPQIIIQRAPPEPPPGPLVTPRGEPLPPGTATGWAPAPPR